MAAARPERRPSEEMALRILEESVKSMTPAALRWRLKPRDEETVSAVVKDMHCAALEVKYQLLRVTCTLRFPAPMSGSSKLIELLMFSVLNSQSPT
jgi:hypothetical protein